MSGERDEGPVYYREIQKNAYLKRIPNEVSVSKLIPLAHKKPPLKPMWTQLCIHNGRTPYLEQYPEAEHPCALSHRPVWRACLSAARHVTGSVRPRQGQEYDFLVDTDHGPVRMLAPDWETMQDWVTTLRNKLAELKITGKGENVYCSPPAPPPPRAAARDPTSPLPPTPPVPLDIVPGIEIVPNRQPETPPEPPEPEPDTSWEPFSLPSTSSQSRERKNVAKICGQNICLDDSVLKREATDSDEEFFAEIDRAHDEYRQTVVVGEVEDATASTSAEGQGSDRPSNITVIQVSNKDAPHTAIPVLGPETDVFDFEFAKTEPTPEPSFVNIVNTEVNVQNSEYGTVFAKTEPEYGHLSLTTTAVNVTDVSVTDVTAVTVNEDKDGLYERLCMASTSAEPRPSPLPRRLRNAEKTRKSSLPNLEANDSAYEFLFLSQQQQQQNVTTTEINASTRDNVADSAERLRSNVERSRSHNAYDNSPRRQVVRVQNGSPKREVKTEKPEQPQKPIWKRGLTELSLLTRLRGIGNGKRSESPQRQENEANDRNTSSPAKVVHRSRTDARVDSSRRRSSSLSNEERPCGDVVLRGLRVREARRLRAEQRRGAALVAPVRASEPPVLVDYERRVWVAWWGAGGARWGGRCGDCLVAVRGVPPANASKAAAAFKHSRHHTVDVLFHRVPLGTIYLLNKRDKESIGIKLDNECNITSVEEDSPAARVGIPPPGKWAVTEVNNRTINLLKGGEEEMNKICHHGTEATVLIQPSDFVKKLRAALKSNKSLLGLR
ncbi:uncharacterized protein LOC115447715 [Manduca sexta]|uniref:uncharacterized protein LOC115447715 n=1 Tax=Manduca sexta TaxID=7130 RepID=UPI00188ED56E|nr:uncharacterized protein LOC115447715 [Manduca sexta]